MVTVTKANFIEQSNDLIQHLPEASFIAIDEEMTGISVPGTGRPIKHHTPEETYETLQQVPQRYSIIQLGVCLFKVVGREWEIRRYNFYMFPADNSNNPTREILLNPGAVQFLHQHNMDFNMWTKHGVPYLNMEETDRAINTYLKKRQTDDEKLEKENEDRAQPTIEEASQRRIEVTRPGDVLTVARGMASIREWLDNAHDRPGTNGTFMLLPPCNSFLRRVFYQKIEIEYPSLILENAGPEHPDQIRIWRLSDAQKRQRQEAIMKQGWEVFILKVGMARVMRAISLACQGKAIPNSHALFAQTQSDIDIKAMLPNLALDRKIPLVVHNGLMDLLFLMTHFHERRLPDFHTTKKLIRSYFPIVYDTKIMATECLTNWRNSSTPLGSLYQNAVLDEEALTNKINAAQTNGDGTPASAQEHEAAYDAFMTGAIFISLCRMINRNDGKTNHGPVLFSKELLQRISDESSPVTKDRFGRNLLYQMSLYTLDLENLSSDPFSRLMSPSTTFQVSAIERSTTTRDIVTALDGKVDQQRRPVHFEIIWVDDTTFIAGVACRPDNAGDDEKAIFNEHGPIVFEALKQKFPASNITRMDKLIKQKPTKRKEKVSFFGLLFGSLFGGKRALEDDDAGGSRKRRRLNT